MRLTIGEAKEFVRARLDELSVEASDMLQNNIDDQNLDNSIEKLIEDAIIYVHSAAPAVLMEGPILTESSFASGGVSLGYRVLEIDTAALSDETADDILRLVSFQCGDSNIKLTTAFHEDTPEAHMQLNEYVQGQPDSPVLVQVDDSPNYRPHYRYYTTDMTQSNLHFALRYFPMPKRRMDEDAIVVAPTSLTFSAEGGTKTVSVTTLAGWSVVTASIPSWLTVSPSSGTGDSTVSITAAANEDNERRASLIFATSEFSVTIEVTQRSGYSETFELSESQLQKDATAGTVSVQLLSSGAWRLSSAKEVPSWITNISPDNGPPSRNEQTITFTLAAYDNILQDRSCTLRFELSGDTSVYDEVLIKQSKAGNLSISPSSVEFQSIGGTKYIGVSCSGPWTVSTPGEGFTVSPTSGTGNGSFAITATAASATRQGTLTISSEGLTSVYLNYSQQATVKTISWYNKTLPVSVDGGKITAYVKADGNWSITCTKNPSAVNRIQPASGTNTNGTYVPVEITILGNSSQESREMKFRASLENDGGYDDLIITQSAAQPVIYLTDPYNTIATSITLDSSWDGSYGVRVVADGNWTAEIISGSDWLSKVTTSSPWSGGKKTASDHYVIWAAYGTNSGQERTAVIKATLTDYPDADPAYFYFTQLSGGSTGGYITLTPEFITVAANETSATAKVKSNRSWQADPSTGCSVSPRSGTGTGQDVTLNVTFPANGGSSKKYYYVTIEGYETKTLAITQNGSDTPSSNIISIDEPTERTEGYLGHSFDITLTATGPWTATGDSWIHLQSFSGQAMNKAPVRVTLGTNPGGPRDGTLIFSLTGTEETATLVIHQEEGVITITPVYASYDNLPFILQGTLVASGPWTAAIDTDDDEFVVVEPTQGDETGGQTISFEGSENEDEDQRINAVVFSLTGTNKTATLTIHQDPYVAPTAPIEVSNTTITTGYTQHDVQITLRSSGAWTASVQTDDRPLNWLTVSPKNGDLVDGLPITLKFTANYLTTNRTATVTFTHTAAGTTATINVTQTGNSTPSLEI